MAEKDSAAADMSMMRQQQGTLKEKFSNLMTYPVVYVLISAILGVVVGIGLSSWSTETDRKELALRWIGLVGDLFVRCLRAAAMPLVFISVAVSFGDMMNVGRASSVGWKTLVLAICTTLIASTVSILTLLPFKALFEVGSVEKIEEIEVTLGCNQPGTYLTQGIEGTITCSAMAPVTMNPEETPAAMKFTFSDLTDSLQKTSSGPATISLSETIYTGVFTKIVTDNIFASLAEGQFAAIACFGLLFGCALSNYLRSTQQATQQITQQISGNLSEHISPTASIVWGFMTEVEGTLVVLIGWFIKGTPVAVFSLIAQAVGRNDNVAASFKNVGYLILVIVLAMTIHMVVVHCVLLAAVLRRNPFDFLKYIVPAQAMAFACSSSAATLPVTMKAVASSGMVPESVWKFVLPLLATLNMDGSAIVFPTASVWLAVQNGVNPTAGDYILLVIVASIGSAGTAPVPAAGIALILTAYNTVFNSTGTPKGFEFIIATDWLLDRFQTIMNITGDSCVSAMVAKWVQAEEDKLARESSDANSAALTSP